jgi:endonuclease
VLYDRPVSELMADAAADLTPPFRPTDVVEWFRQRYPLVKDKTVRAHVIGLTANDRNRHHYAWLANREPLFFRHLDGALEPFDPDRHLTDDDGAVVPDGELVEGIDSEATPLPSQAPQFFLERYLEQFLLDNWSSVGWGRRLVLWKGEDGRSGHQYATPIGRLDFLCVDEDTNALVVVELKRGSPSDQVVGQTARYMGWVAAHAAGPGQAVEGVIIAHDAHDRLRYAVQPVPGMSVLLYEVSFSLRPAVLVHAT